MFISGINIMHHTIEARRVSLHYAISIYAYMLVLCLCTSILFCISSDTFTAIYTMTMFFHIITVIDKKQCVVLYISILASSLAPT